MRPEEFCDAIGQIDEKYIEEARVARKKRSFLPKLLTSAACLVLAVTVGVLLFLPDRSRIPADIPTDPTVPADKLVVNAPTSILNAQYPVGEYSYWSNSDRVTPEEAFSQFTGLDYEAFVQRLPTPWTFMDYEIYTVRPEDPDGLVDYDCMPRDFTFYYEQNNKQARVGVSAEGYPLRGFRIGGSEDDVTSYINDVSMLVYQHGEGYYVYFQFYGLYYDVMTNGTLDELEQILDALTETPPVMVDRIVTNEPAGLYDLGHLFVDYSHWSEADQVTKEEAFLIFTGLNYDTFTKKLPAPWAFTEYEVHAVMPHVSIDQIYAQPRDFLFFYAKDTYSAQVSVSAEGYPLKQLTFVDSDDDVWSAVNGVPIMIYVYDGKYYATFTLDGLYYDVETDASLEELEQILDVLTKTAPIEPPGENDLRFNMVYLEDQTPLLDYLLDSALDSTGGPRDVSVEEFERTIGRDFEAIRDQILSPWVFQKCWAPSRASSIYPPSTFILTYRCEVPGEANVGVSVCDPALTDPPQPFPCDDPFISTVNGVKIMLYHVQSQDGLFFDRAYFCLDGLSYCVGLYTNDLVVWKQFLSDLTAPQATPDVPDPPEEEELLFTMLRYHWDGYGVGEKAIFSCDLGEQIVEALSKLEETGQTAPKISDEVVDTDSGILPVTPGTVWIEYEGGGLFRLDPSMDEICKVETHLGEGKVLKMTDELSDLLGQAWSYYPNDCWSGAYENGNVTLEQVWKADSAVASVAVDSIDIEKEPHSEENRITLRFLARESKFVEVRLESYQSDDNLAHGDFTDITLKKGRETTVDLTFGGFTHPYWITIVIDNTRITLEIDPGTTN